MATWSATASMVQRALIAAAASPSTATGHGSGLQGRKPTLALLAPATAMREDAASTWSSTDCPAAAVGACASTAGTIQLVVTATTAGRASIVIQAVS